MREIFYERKTATSTTIESSKFNSKSKIAACMHSTTNIQHSFACLLICSHRTILYRKLSRQKKTKLRPNIWISMCFRISTENTHWTSSQVGTKRFSHTTASFYECSKSPQNSNEPIQPISTLSLCECTHWNRSKLSCVLVYECRCAAFERWQSFYHQIDHDIIMRP